MTLTFKFKDIHTIIVTSSKVVKGWMSGQDPISISVFSSLVNLVLGVEIPESQSLIFGVRKEDLQSWMEKHA